MDDGESNIAAIFAAQQMKDNSPEEGSEMVQAGRRVRWGGRATSRAGKGGGLRAYA